MSATEAHSATCRYPDLPRDKCGCFGPDAKPMSATEARLRDAAADALVCMEEAWPDRPATLALRAILAALPDDGREGLDVERLKQAHRNLFTETGHGLFGGYVEALAAEYDRLIPADKP